MKTKLFILGVCSMVLVLTGCRSTLDGKHTFTASFMNDTVESGYERPFDQVWKAAKDTLTYNGTLTGEDVVKKVLTAKVDTRTVWLMVESINANPPYLTRVYIQTKTKGGGTDKSLGAELDKQIALRLATGNLTPATAPAKTR